MERGFSGSERRKSVEKRRTTSTFSTFSTLLS